MVLSDTSARAQHTQPTHTTIYHYQLPPIHPPRSWMHQNYQYINSAATIVSVTAGSKYSLNNRPAAKQYSNALNSQRSRRQTWRLHSFTTSPVVSPSLHTPAKTESEGPSSQYLRTPASLALRTKTPTARRAVDDDDHDDAIVDVVVRWRGFGRRCYRGKAKPRVHVVVTADVTRSDSASDAILVILCSFSSLPFTVLFALSWENFISNRPNHNTTIAIAIAATTINDDTCLMRSVKY